MIRFNRLSATLAALVMAAAVASPVAVFAADGSGVQISTNTESGQAQSEVELEKTEEVTPTYTVTVPAKIVLGKASTSLNYELKLNDNGDNVPTGKQVAVQIQSAGPATSLARTGNEFKVEGTEKSGWDSVTYQIYDSDRAANPHYYSVGEDLVVWNAGNHGIQQRVAKVKDYDSVKPDTYTGVINYTIELRDKQ